MTQDYKKQTAVLVNDPSIRAWGFIVVGIDNGKIEILEVGCIKTEPEAKKRRIRKGDDTVRRIQEVNSTLLRLFKRYNIVHILTEQPHGSQSASAAVMIGMVTGMVQTISDCLNVGVEWYSEGECKYYLLGKRSATKNEVKEAVKKIYKINWTGVGYKDEAIADAMAVFHFACTNSPMLAMLMKNSK